MKRFNFIKDEKGAILILGAFFLLFIGMWLLALSLDLPMTFNREQSAQSMIRQATSSAAKQMQYMKYSGSVEQALKNLDQGNSRVFSTTELPPEKIKNDLRSIDAADTEDVRVSPNSTILWQGVAYNIEGSGADLSDPDNLNAFLNKPDIIAKAENHMRRVLENKMPAGACIKVPGVRQNDDGKNYLFAYMDYPDNTIFDKAAISQDEEGNTYSNYSAPTETCDCNSNVPTPGCSRVVSGQLFSDESDSWVDAKNDDGQPWEIFRDGLRTEIVVETSHQTLNAPFDFIGYTLTAVDEALGYEVGDDVEDTFAGWIRFGAMLHAPLANVDLSANYIPTSTDSGTLKVGNCTITIDGSSAAGDWTGCLTASTTNINSVEDILKGGHCEYQAVQSSAYSPRVDFARLHSRACWEPVWSHKIEQGDPIKCIKKHEIEGPVTSSTNCPKTPCCVERNKKGKCTKEGMCPTACCKGNLPNQAAVDRCEGDCNVSNWWDNPICTDEHQEDFTKITWDDECSKDNAEETAYIKDPDFEFRVSRGSMMLPFGQYDLVTSEETYFEGFYSTFGSFYSEEVFHNTWLSFLDGAVSNMFTALGDNKLKKNITHEIFDFQGYPYMSDYNPNKIKEDKFWGPFKDKSSIVTGLGIIFGGGPALETVSMLKIDDQDPATFIDGNYRIVPQGASASGIYPLPVGIYTIEGKPKELADGVPDSKPWCERPDGWMQGPEDENCIMDRAKAEEAIAAYPAGVCPEYKGKGTVMQILEKDLRERCQGNCPGDVNTLAYNNVIEMEVIQDNPKQVVYGDKLFANSQMVESYGHQSGERKKEVQTAIAEMIEDGTSHELVEGQDEEIITQEFMELQVQDAIGVADYTELYRDRITGEDRILTYEDFPKTGLLPVEEALKIKHATEDGGEDWKKFLIAEEELPFGGTIETPGSYYNVTFRRVYSPPKVTGVSHMDGLLAWASTDWLRLGEVYVQSTRCSGTARANFTTPFGKWNETRDHMREVLPNIKIEANGLNAGAWCPAIAMAVDSMLNTNTNPPTNCKDPHQRCILPLFISEAPDDSQYLRDGNNNFSNIALDAFTLDGQLDSAGTIHYSRDEQYRCAKDVLKYFKDQGGIVIVVGLEGLGIEEPTKFADWIAEVTGDVNKSYLVGQRGMFLRSQTEDGEYLTDSKLITSDEYGKADLTATKADVLQSLLWNFTPNTIEVCQGKSCE